MSSHGALLSVTDLHKHFPVKHGILIERTVDWVRAVDGVSFEIQEGETLGLVGESGSGKSTTGYCILQLLRPTSGSIRFLGKELTQLPREELRRMRREMQIVFQDPYASLDPRMTVGNIVSEPLEVHGIGTRRSRRETVRRLLDVVGFNPNYTNRYPHEFSGGQRQRIGIARALALNPKMIVCDEPVSALDVSIQAQILNLLKDLQRDFGLTYLFIAHDLAVVRTMSDRIAVMHLGKIVEIGPSEEVYKSPKHAYTKTLLSAVPIPDPRKMKERKAERAYVRVPKPSAPYEKRRGYFIRPRSPIAVILLSLITLGFYYLYWFYKVNEDAAILNHDDKAKPALSLLAASLGAFLIIPPYWTHWTTAKRVGKATGYTSRWWVNLVCSIVLYPFAIVVYVIWVQGKLNKYGREQRGQTDRTSGAKTEL